MSMLGFIKAGLAAAAPNIRQQVENARVEAAPVPEEMGRSYRDYEDNYATLTVLDTDNQEVLTIEYILLQGVAESFRPKNAAVYSFGNAMVYTSGEGPRQFNYTAALIVNAKDGDTRADLAQEYERTLRLSKMVSGEAEGRVVRLSYRDQVRLGYLTSMTTNINADNLNRVDLNFSMFVTDLYSHAPAAAQLTDTLRFSDQVANPQDERVLGAITFDTDS